MKKIDINNAYYLTEPHEGDIPLYLKYFGDREIHDNTLNIPYPYTESDARWYLDNCKAEAKRIGHPISFVIRNKRGELIGGASFHGNNSKPTTRHKDEVAYWLAKQYWNKGIMSLVLPVLIKYGEDVCNLKRFEALIFSSNIASEKVLIKCGFKLEGYIEQAYIKDGVFIDGKLYALIKKKVIL